MFCSSNIGGKPIGGVINLQQILRDPKHNVEALTRSTSYEVLANASCKDVLAPHKPGKNLHLLLVQEGNTPENKKSVFVFQ